jgi:hypothetical protein
MLMENGKGGELKKLAGEHVWNNPENKVEEIVHRRGINHTAPHLGGFVDFLV